jgi:hypothetical protein
VGDHDELNTSRELGQQIREALHVRLVERGVHLVQHTERGWIDLEQPEQQRDHGKCTLTPAQRQQPLQLLARRSGHDVDARAKQIIGIGKHQARLAAAEQLRKAILERFLDGAEGRRKTLAHVAFELCRRGLQVGHRGAQVG